MKKEKDVLSILEKIVKKVKLEKVYIESQKLQKKIDYISRCASNRAAIRLLISSMVAKVYDKNVDPRKPYTEIGTSDSFSGRTIDEKYLSKFIIKYKLPCNPTTAFLTPVLRNRNEPLNLETELVGRPRDVYKNTQEILHEVAIKKIKAIDVLYESIKILLLLKKENENRLKILKQGLRSSTDITHLSSENIVDILRQHLLCKYSSRLPVLMVFAMYRCAENYLKEKTLELKAHNSADKQTGSIGDIEITLINDNNIVTSYEMKAKKIDISDIHVALNKIKNVPTINNYIFITTDIVEDEIFEMCKEVYKEIGVEIAA